jgi:hypothetical protein
MPGANNNNENEKDHHLEGKKLKNLLKNSANDFSNMFKKAANSHGANMATRKKAANVQNAINAARERIAKALASAGGAGKGGGRRTRRRNRRSSRGRK